jgi:hypothetical protein
VLSPIICEPNGPYYTNVAYDPGMVDLKGTAMCPPGQMLHETSWTSESGHVKFNGAHAEVSAAGNFVLCQTVICVDPGTGEQSTSQCCTTLHAEKIHTEVDVKHTCETNGPYHINAPSLPGIVELTGDASCAANYVLLEAFWSSPSLEVGLPVPTNPATAKVSAFGNHIVCQIVTCLNPVTGETAPTKCCTALQLDEIALPGGKGNGKGQQRDVGKGVNGKGYGPPRGNDPYADHGHRHPDPHDLNEHRSSSSRHYRKRELLKVPDDVSIETKQVVVSDSIWNPTITVWILLTSLREVLCTFANVHMWYKKIDYI